LQIVAELFLIVPLIYYTGHILESVLDLLGFIKPDYDGWHRKIWKFPLTIIPFLVILRVQRHWEELKKLEAITPES
jgi:hypothetical protein